VEALLSSSAVADRQLQWRASTTTDSVCSGSGVLACARSCRAVRVLLDSASSTTRASLARSQDSRVRVPVLAWCAIAAHGANDVDNNESEEEPMHDDDCAAMIEQLSVQVPRDELLASFSTLGRAPTTSFILSLSTTNGDTLITECAFAHCVHQMSRVHCPANNALRCSFVFATDYSRQLSR
jgi:hypothetical protein